jgi:signal transduction histidine kinase
VSPASTTDSLRASGRHADRYHSHSRHLHLSGQSSGESTAAPDPFDRRDRFAAYVAHELRTPIALQLALAEAALADPHADKVAFRAICEDIVDSCEQQQRLIEALLDLTHSNRGLTRREPVDVAAITSRALQAYELSELDSVVALEPAVAIGDPTLLERLAANLVSNAIRHNIPHGRIEVATRTDAGWALLSVANTGPLIPAGELTRLFQPFQRLGSHPQACSDGLGLGLAIVQSIADAHNANLAAYAHAGGGLAVEVRFPASVNTCGARIDEGACAG